MKHGIMWLSMSGTYVYFTGRERESRKFTFITEDNETAHSVHIHVLSFCKQEIVMEKKLSQELS